MNKKINYKTIILFILLFLVNDNLFGALTKSNSILKTSVEIKGFGTLYLQKPKEKNAASTQLILKNSKNINIVIDSYDGLEPYELMKLDFDNNGIAEIVATLRYPDNENVIPYVYTLKAEGLEKIFPNEGEESKLASCREVFSNNSTSKPVLCLKYLVSYHDYAPPELFRLESYEMKNGKLILSQVGYNEGNHFNLLMNLATEYLYKGKAKEAASVYKKLLTSKFNMPNKAISEALFYYAEALKFSGQYSEAMKTFEKIVLEYTDSHYTEMAQRELEFLHDNTADPNNIKLLDQFFKILLEIDYSHSSEALSHLNQFIAKNPNCNFMDKMLFMKAELLVSENQIDEAMSVFTDIKVKFPNSSLIELVEEMLENLESKPEDIEGL